MGASVERLAPASLPDYLGPIWSEFVEQYEASSDLEIETLCGLVHRLRDSRERITAEGIVVVDKSGNPSPHPALETERQVQREIRAWEASPGAKRSAALRRASSRTT